MKLRIIISLIFTFSLLVSCSHVNHLNKYNFERREIYFEEQIGANAHEVNLSINAPQAPAQTTAETVKNVVVAVGSSLLTSETERKLRNASSPVKIVKGISQGVQDNMVKFLRIIPTNQLTESSDFIVITTLDKCRLFSNSEGIFVNVEAAVRIYDRNGGKLIWEYEDSETIRMRKTAISNVSDATGMSGVSQVADLLLLTEEQLSASVKEAAISVGRNIAEVLREDISKSR
jgi:hypothetical protein